MGAQGRVWGWECWDGVLRCNYGDGIMGTGVWECEHLDGKVGIVARGRQLADGSIMACRVGLGPFFPIILNFFSPFIYFFFPALLKKSK